MIYHAFQNLLEERRAEGFYLTEPQNYIDVFLKKIHDSKEENDSLYTGNILQK